MRYEQQLAAQGSPMPTRQQLSREVLDRLITEKAQLQVARESGVRADDALARQARDQHRDQQHRRQPVREKLHPGPAVHDLPRFRKQHAQVDSSSREKGRHREVPPDEPRVRRGHVEGG